MNKKYYDIVYITDIATITSGGSRFFVELASAMSKYFKVALITGKLDPTAKNMLKGVDVYNGDIYGSCELPYTCPQRLVKFAVYTFKVLKTINYKILHTNSHFPNFWAYLYPARVIGTIHHIEEIPRLKPLADIIQLLEIHAPYLLLLTPNPQLKNSKSVVIPPILHFRAPAIARRPEPGLILMIGRLEERKHYDIALQALKIARSIRPELRLVIIGDGPLRDKLEILARRLGIDQAVEFKGHVSEREKYELLSRAELFLHIGHPEGFGIAVLEACSSGIICIIYEKIPIVNLFRQKILTIKKLDPKEIATKIVYFKSKLLHISHSDINELSFEHIYNILYKKLILNEK